MSLAERLAQRRGSEAAERARGAAAAVVRTTGPLAEIRRRVHRKLQEILGPQLYNERSTEVLEQRVQATRGAEAIDVALGQDRSHPGGQAASPVVIAEEGVPLTLSIREAEQLAI